MLKEKAFVFNFSGWIINWLRRRHRRRRRRRHDAANVAPEVSSVAGEARFT